MAKNYNPEIVDAVKDFLDNDDWHYSFDEERGLFRFGVSLPGKMKSVQYVVGINEHDYNVYAMSPISADQEEPETMRQMAEFVCRANYGLRDGNFELDFRDGELRYKCYMNCNGSMPSREMVEATIQCPAAMFKRYSKGILQILFNDMSAEDAIELCEGKPAGPVNDDSDEEDTSSQLMELLRRLRESRGDSEDDESSEEDESSEDDMSKASDE